MNMSLCVTKHPQNDPITAVRVNFTRM